ncbi:ABC transporter permease [Haladaptatus sp. R4]|uniref:ABC transporter permease n=1 Tax=Haladaptatus sp. R4 TaxID=1679489 RepID=UPI0009ED1348|nr:ABC transporter permease [Haladaptatus sp. R4]
MSTQSENASTTSTLKEQWKPRIERFRRGWSRYTQHKMGVIGLIILVVYILWALFPSVFAPHSLDWRAFTGTDQYARISLQQQQQLPYPPVFGDPFFAPFGTTDDGVGVLTLLIYSTKTALYIGFAAGLLSSLVGVPLGLISGFYGDTWIDEAIQRIVDVMYGLPFLPFLIVLVAVNGVNTTNIIIGIAVTSWLNNCILIRGETLSLKERAYIESARVAGASDTRIVFRHILPNVIPLAFVFLAQDAAGAILAQASLAFLGYAPTNTHSWGVMLENVQANGHIFDAPWWLIPPGLAITSLAAAFYFIGFSVEDLANPQE